MRNREMGFSLEGEQNPETGHNNRILLKMVRHGERTPDGVLTDYGRTVTREKAKAEKVEFEGVDIIKAMGSDSGPKSETGMGRSRETADIFAESVALTDGESVQDADKKIAKYQTRRRKLLELEGRTSPEPFDWKEYYNSFLPKNFDTLTDEEKAEASHVAQKEAVNRLLTMPEAEQYRTEIASRQAVFVDRYIRMVDRLKNDSKVAIPAGTHGGLMEPFLQKILRRINKKTGEGTTGFKDVEEIGGPFRPSEGFYIDITTNEAGEKNIVVELGEGHQNPDEEYTLDQDVLKELVQVYNEQQQQNEHE